MTKLITIGEASTITTLSRRSIGRLIAAGKITKRQLSPGRVALDLDEINQYIAESKKWASDTKPAKSAITFASENVGSKLLALLSAKPTRKRTT